MNKIVIFFFFIVISQGAFSQINDSVLVKKNSRIVLSSCGLAVGYVSSIYLLNQTWYSNYPKSSFHFFNDNREWMQMDKIGHISTAYVVSSLGIELMKWSGIKRKPAILIGGSIGSLYMTTIEVLDGYSLEWGASYGDIIANTIGSGLAVLQEFSGNKIVDLKWSYHETRYAKMRPNLLGNNLPQRMLKDYNGQTYWLSFNIKNIIKKGSIPPWLNIAFGYSVDGMLGACNNPVSYNGVYFSNYKRTRQFFLSFDIKTNSIKTNNKILNRVFKVINVVKFPLPTIGFEHGKSAFYPMYF
ncbi:MAG: DUF2279 domain-containing protein [Bacteroidota bacterium]